MPTVTVQAHEGESLTVRVQAYEDAVAHRLRTVPYTEEVQVGDPPMPVKITSMKVESYTEPVKQWVDQRIDTFATDRRQFEVHEGQRIVVETA